MKKLLIITYLLTLHIFNSQAQWAQEGNNLLGKMQYYHGGSLGYGIRTSEGGGWAWQFVDGINNQYFHVEYPTGNVGIGTNNPTSKLDVHGEVFSNNNPITLRKGTTGQFVLKVIVLQ